MKTSILAFFLMLPMLSFTAGVGLRAVYFR